MITLDQAIDTVTQLSFDQQEMLIDIIHNRHIETRRQKIAQDARESLATFREGRLKPQSAQEIIVELRQWLNEQSSGEAIEE